MAKQPSLTQEKGPAQTLGFPASSTMRRKFLGLRMSLRGRVQAVYITHGTLGPFPSTPETNKAVDLRHGLLFTLESLCHSARVGQGAPSPVLLLVMNWRQVVGPQESPVTAERPGAG